MPAAGVTAKLPSPLNSAGLPPALDRQEPLPLPEHTELPPAPDRQEPLPVSDHHEPPSPPDFDPVREALCSVGPVAAAWAAQEAELDAEIAALEAAGLLTAPAEEELPGPDFDPGSVPPQWLADLPGAPYDECLVATADAATPETPRPRRRDRASSDGLGFAAGGDAELLSPGAALAGLAEHARAAGLGRLTDDELAGVIRAGRRLASWASGLELAAVSDLMRRREQ